MELAFCVPSPNYPRFHGYWSQRNIVILWRLSDLIGGERGVGGMSVYEGMKGNMVIVNAGEREGG